MRVLLKSGLLCVGGFVASLSATECTRAADPESVFIKAGETVDLGPVYWQSNCHSTLKSPPFAEVMEGPSEITVSVKPQKVMPRKYSCAKPIDGAELSISAAKDIKARTQGKLFLRIRYPTKDGDRQNGREINYTLFPTSQAATSTQDAK